MTPERRRSWIRRLLRRGELRQIEREIDEEFRFHLEMKAEALAAGGLDPAEARALAARSFGDAEGLRRSGARQLSAVVRRERRAHVLDWLGQDLREGVRRLVRRPGFTLLAVGTLALGLATSTAVFTWVDAYRRPFPGADARNLFQAYSQSEAVPWGPLSYPDFEDLAASTDGSFDVAGAGASLFAASVRHEDLTEVVFGHAVTGSYFPVVRVRVAIGRPLTPDDDRPEATPAVVISHGYWARRYGSDPDVVGRTILLNNQPYTIVGVADPSFIGSSAAFRPDVWMPFESYMRVYWARSSARTDRELATIFPYVRLADGATVARAREAVAALAHGLDREAPLESRSRIFALEPATWIGPGTRDAEASTNRLMMLTAALLLLLACANVANLVLSAGARRRSELAVRGALGASRARLVRQLLTESLLLSIVAGLLGVVVAGPAAARIGSYLARPSVWGAFVPRETGIDPRVMGFALAATLVTTVLTGLVPALRASGRNPASALSASGRWASDASAGWRSRIPGTRDLLVSAQVALSVVLLFLAGLVVRTLESAKSVDAGFDTGTTLASYVSTSSMGVPVEERHIFFDGLIRRFREIPWVRDATVAENAPLSPHPTAELRVDGTAEPVTVTVARVYPGFFEALDVRILHGRALLESDTVRDAGVVVVNEALARRMSDDGNPVGQRLWWPGANDQPDRGFDVVGVARNTRQTSYLEEPGPVAWFSLPQHYSAPGNAFLLKVAGSPAVAVADMERELRAVDSRIAIVNILPYSQVVRGFLYAQRMNAELFSVIALIGLLLAAAGVFGVVSLAVARRQREIGIRIAIGAPGTSIGGLVLATVAGPVLLGLLAGLAGAFATSRFTESLLWNIAPTDPVSLGVGIAVLLAAVAFAVIMPLARALHMDPVRSLRVE